MSYFVRSRALPVTLALALSQVAAAQAPVQFAFTIGSKDFTSDAYPTLGIGLGKTMGVMGGQNLLWYIEEGASSGGSAASMPGEGLHQAIDDVAADAALSIIIDAGAYDPDDAGKFARVGVIVQGVTKAALASLPLRVPDGADGEVVIEAIDFAARTIRGTFVATTGPAIATNAPGLQIAAGRFDVLSR